MAPRGLGGATVAPMIYTGREISMNHREIKPDLAGELPVPLLFRPKPGRDQSNTPATRPNSMKARAVRLSASAISSASLAFFSNSAKVLSKVRRK